MGVPRGMARHACATAHRRAPVDTCVSLSAASLLDRRDRVAASASAIAKVRPLGGCRNLEHAHDLAPPMQPLSCGSPLEDSVDEQVARAVVFTAIVGVPLRWAIAIGIFTGASNVIPYMGFAAAMLGGLAYAVLAEDNHRDSDHHDRESPRREQRQTSHSLRAGLSGSCDRRMDRRSGCRSSAR
jgi:hypothetical protein